MCSRSGFGLFIASVNIVIFGMGVIVFIGALCNQNKVKHLGQVNAIKHPDVTAKEFARILNSLVVFLLVLCFFIVVFSGVLAVGIIMRRHKYMVPWLVVYAFSIVCGLLCDVVTLFEDPRGIFACAMCVTFVQCLLFYHNYSFYRDVRKDHLSKRDEMYE